MPFDLTHSVLVGQGKTTIATAEYLLKIGHRLTIYSLKPNRLPKHLARYYSQDPKSYTLVWLSPGLSPSSAILKTLSQSVPWILDIDYFLCQTAAKCILVTGTNGKSSSVKYIHDVLHATGESCVMGGNYQPGILQALLDKPTWAVIELSSYQLHWMYQDHQVLATMLLNISPNHDRWHGSFGAYNKAKQRLCGWGKYHIEDGECNKAATDALLKAIGVDRTQYVPYPQLPYRQELHRIDDKVFINDSKSTNIASTIYAINRVKAEFKYQPILLILAGVSKQASHAMLIKHLSGVEVVVCGNDFQDLNYLLLARYRCIEELKPCMMDFEGVILFSPAGSSHDGYTSFAARGALFNQLIYSTQAG